MMFVWSLDYQHILLHNEKKYHNVINSCIVAPYHTTLCVKGGS